MFFGGGACAIGLYSQNTVAASHISPDYGGQVGVA